MIHFHGSEGEVGRVAEISWKQPRLLENVVFKSSDTALRVIGPSG